MGMKKLEVKRLQRTSKPSPQIPFWSRPFIYRYLEAFAIARAEVWTAVAESVPGGAFAAGAEVPVASGESIYSVRVVED